MYSPGKCVLSFPNYIGFKVKELPDPDGQSTIRLRVTKARNQSINRLANPRAIISANIQNGFGGNKEDETCSLSSMPVIAIRKSSQTLMCWVLLLAE